MGGFRGVYAAMVSAFDDEGALSLERTRAYSRWLASRGVDGLFPFGTTGEWPHLTEEERMLGAEAVIAEARAASAAGARVKVIVHAGAHTTESARRLVAHARSAGADAASVICPPYYALDDDAVAAHFAAAAAAAPDLPLFVYAIPGMTRSEITPGLLARIRRESPNVVGVKYSGDSIVRFREYRKAAGSDFSVFIGDDGLALPAFLEGADGVVSGNASAAPELLVSLYGTVAGGGGAGAGGRGGAPGSPGAPGAGPREAQAELDGFIGRMDPRAELSCFKTILALRGAPVGEVRPPLKRLSRGGHVDMSALVAEFEAKGVFRRNR